MVNKYFTTLLTMRLAKSSLAQPYRPPGSLGIFFPFSGLAWSLLNVMVDHS